MISEIWRSINSNSNARYIDLTGVSESQTTPQIVSHAAVLSQVRGVQPFPRLRASRCSRCTAPVCRRPLLDVVSLLPCCYPIISRCRRQRQLLRCVSSCRMAVVRDGGQLAAAQRPVADRKLQLHGNPASRASLQSTCGAPRPT
jgi:hypothetical protein